MSAGEIILHDPKETHLISLHFTYVKGTVHYILGNMLIHFLTKRWATSTLLDPRFKMYHCNHI